MPPWFGNAKSLAALGFHGVDLFFVLSGFLITGILLDTADSPRYFQSFYIHRSLRIFPLYFTFLGLILFLAHSDHGMSRLLPPPQDWSLYFIYLTNWRAPDLRAVNLIGHFWTLAIEEQFYFIWPVIIRFTPRRRLTPLFLGGILAAFVLRLFLALPTRNTFCRMDGLLFGALAAWLIRSKPEHRVQEIAGWMARATPLLVIAAVLLETRAPAGPLYSLAFTCWCAASFGLILWLFAERRHPSPAGWIWRTSGMRWLGKYSYGIYVFHPMLFFITASFLGPITPASALPFAAIASGVSFAAAGFSYRYFEARFLQAKRSFDLRPGSLHVMQPILVCKK